MAKNKKQRKAVVFIVEGKSDKNAMEHIFQVIYRYKNITFEFTRGDITSDYDISKEKMLEIIYDKVDAYMKEKKLNKSNIWQIVHIFDTDGTYIPDSAVGVGDTKAFLYSTTMLTCKNPDKIKSRNAYKKEMMDYLLGLSEIKGIPYKCYYMSSNLDHALYNKLNLTDEEKEAYSNEFYDLFDGREKLFIDFLNSDVVNGCPESFPASWRYIKEELHSLERHTNLHIYFKENPFL